MYFLARRQADKQSSPSKLRQAWKDAEAAKQRLEDERRKEEAPGLDGSLRPYVAKSQILLQVVVIRLESAEQHPQCKS